MEGAGFWVLAIFLVILSACITLAIYEDPRCLIVECTLVQDINK